jgi:AcrR family transcriptional regulator
MTHMAKLVQKRSIKTRERLISAAEEIIAENGYDGLRVDELVLRAGVAKGTFFTHFKDKDALMEVLLGGQMDRVLDDMAAGAVPRNAAEVASRLHPLVELMTCERYVFDLIIRHSGAAAIEEIGAIAMAFGKFDAVLAQWFEKAGFRPTVDPHLLAEGVQAFAVQAMALNFCAINGRRPLKDRLRDYLIAWLEPEQPGT